MIEEQIAHCLRGNRAAVDAFLCLRDILHFWDDLIDQDREIDSGFVNRSMFKALVLLPSNPFWRQHQDSLLPILVNAIGNWHAANQFESGDDRKRLELAFVIRSDYANLLIHMAYLVGGYEWMVAVTPSIRELWTSEDFSGYLCNLRTEQEARAKGEKDVL